MVRAVMITIYKLECSDGIYIGSTSNLRRRLNEHRKHRDGLCLRYGVKEFSVETLEIVTSKNDGYASEFKWCNYYRSRGGNIIGQKHGQVFTLELSERFSKLKTAEFYSGKSRNRVLRMNAGKKIRVIDQFGTVYESFSHCARKINSYPSSVMDVVSGKSKHTKGFILTRFI